MSLKKHYVRDCITFAFVNESKKKFDQCYFDCISSNGQKHKCVILFFHFNDALYNHYHDHNKHDDR